MPTYFFYALIGLVLWGTAPILGKLGLTKTDPVVGMAARSFTISIIMFFWLLINQKFSQLWQTDIASLGLVVGEGILASLLGHLAYYYALKQGTPAIITPMMASFPLVTVFLSVLFLNETLSFNKILGAIFIVIGVIVLNK